MYEFCINVRFEDLRLDAIQYISHIIKHLHYIIKGRIHIRPIVEIEVDPKEDRNNMSRKHNSQAVHSNDVFFSGLLLSENQPQKEENPKEASYDATGKQALKTGSLILAKLENTSVESSYRTYRIGVKEVYQG